MHSSINAVRKGASGPNTQANEASTSAPALLRALCVSASSALSSTTRNQIRIERTVSIPTCRTITQLKLNADFHRYYMCSRHSPRFTNLILRRCPDVQSSHCISLAGRSVRLDAGNNSTSAISKSTHQASRSQSACACLGKYEFRYLSLSAYKVVGKDQRGRVHV